MRRLIALIAAGMTCLGGRLGAQTVEAHLTARGPVFFALSSSGARVDARANAALRRPIAVDLHGASLAQALDTIAARAGFPINFNAATLPTTVQVNLSAARITVEGALTVVLLDAGFDVQMTGAERAVLVPRRDLPRSGVAVRQQITAIVGRVTDATTAQGLPEVAVSIVGTEQRTRTDRGGTYHLAVAPGTYTVTTRLFGYAPATTTVVVARDSVSRADFVLVQSAVKLDELVVTGAGPQRRVELGNSIATISADSITPTAPITSLTDLLSGRAANVDVVAGSGVVGDGPAIRIRGRSSITVPNDPILIIDGVRADASPGGQVDVFSLGDPHTSASRLNDLDPDQIATVEVLRGPGAATEYGTDAANGVIIVTTKRGQAGAPRWDFRTEQAASEMPKTFPAVYRSWGHLTGTTTPTACPFLATFGGASLYDGSCAVDSVTAFQPLNHAATSLFGTGYRGQYDVQTSGGTERLRYFVAGSVSGERGPMRMPPAEVTAVERTQHRSVPEDQLHPNTLNQAQGRGRVDATVGKTAEVSLQAAYVSTSQRTPNVGATLAGAFEGAGYRDSLNGYDLQGFDVPRFHLAETSNEGVNRFTGSIAGRWQPVTWLSTRATLGLDDASRSTVSQLLPGQSSPFYQGFIPFQFGFRERGSYRTGYYTVDVGSTATLSFASVFTSKTTVGAQYYDRRESGTTVAVANIPSNNPSLNGGALYNNSLQERKDEAITAGVYGEETLSWRERLFLTGGVRADAGSGFGAKYTSALYPKASASWVAFRQPGPISLRLRAAYGESGVQPRAGAALQLLAPGQVMTGPSRSVLGDTLVQPGNPHLKPERSSELEGGFDLGLWGERLTIEATVYDKHTTNALIDVPLAGSLARYVMEENLGAVQNRGLELGVSVRPVDTRLVSWDLSVSGSINLNRLLSLAPGVTGIDGGLTYTSPWRQRVGYPLYGFWALPLSYNDANHDGRLEPNEVRVGDTAVFVGPSLPTKQLSVSTGVSLFGRRIRIATLVDARGGNRLTNAIGFVQSFAYQNNAGLNNPHAPLSEQARALGVVEVLNAGGFNSTGLSTNVGYVEDASFVRWRELSVTYSIAPSAVRWFRGREASITLAARNLALWTKYTGSDPEANNQSGFNRLTVAGLPTTAANRDIVGDYAATPLLRYWVLKVAVGL